MKKEIIQGKQIRYMLLTAEQGHCFYDVEDESRNYMTSIYTPILTDEEIARQYVEVEGNADDLNAKLMEELDNGRQQEVD
jgi:hypothetical protein